MKEKLIAKFIRLERRISWLQDALNLCFEYAKEVPKISALGVGIPFLALICWDVAIIASRWLERPADAGKQYWVYALPPIATLAGAIVLFITFVATQSSQ